MVTGSHGVRMQFNYVHDTAGLPGEVSSVAARWLRLTRDGNVITGYDSAVGKDWDLVGTARERESAPYRPGGPVRYLTYL